MQNVIMMKAKLKLNSWLTQNVKLTEQHNSRLITKLKVRKIKFNLLHNLLIQKRYHLLRITEKLIELSKTNK